MVRTSKMNFNQPPNDSKYWTYVERARLAALIRLLPKRGFTRVLDCGCGRGEFLLGFCKAAKIDEARGVDGSPDAVAEARTRGIDASVCNLNKDCLPADDSSSDLVMMVETIEHLEDVEHCLDEIRRVLKPSGSLLISTPNLASWHGRLSLALGFQPLSLDVGYRKHYGSLLTFSGKSAGHIRAFTRSALSDILDSSGFQVDQWSSSPAVVTGGSRPIRLLRAVDRGLSVFPNIASELIVRATRRPE